MHIHTEERRNHPRVTEPNLIKLDAVKRICGLSRASIYGAVKLGDLSSARQAHPARNRLGEGRSGRMGSAAYRNQPSKRYQSRLIRLDAINGAGPRAPCWLGRVLIVCFRQSRLFLAASAAGNVSNVVRSEQPNKNSQSTGSSRNPSNSPGVFHTFFIPNKKGLRRNRVSL